MAHYRLTHLDLSTRIALVLEMLQPIPERQWGRATELAETYNLSRTLLYQLRDRVAAVIAEVLSPHQPGPQPQGASLVIDRAFIQRAVVILSLLKGTVRDIQNGLDLLLGVERSVGYISQTLNGAGAQATVRNQAVVVPVPILGEADEIFQGRKPCLTLVDGRSFLVLNLTPADSRDATTWGVTYLELLERGIRFHDLASDGGTGLLAGVKEAQLAIPLRPDLFHLLQDAYRLTRRLEAAAYRAIETAERARRAELEAQGLIRRRGPRLKLKTPLAQAEVQEAQAIAVFDAWEWLLGEIRRALEPFRPDGQLVSVAAAQATLLTAVGLLEELGHKDITAFTDDLREKMPQLLAPLAWLEQQLAVVFQGLDVDSQAFILWVWQHRQALGVDIATDMPVALQAASHAVWDTLGLFHRSSSLAESLHSWLRPYLRIHRGMPTWLLPLLQLFWNHHRFERGKRAGSSPLELAGVEQVPTLAEVLGQLFRPSVGAQTV
jgi:hypothetical protein